ncbi:WecB/TagA/CpsF family glycosyltransferase [Robiginitomaculum antarcticum]|uniref:WecB/TagA/CpsF family glycosyltransferase n=1 Tax=Robiginitomaculum antarcticum TaxID=437507 RepID=UPI00036FF414|nr:WecB/TagA/CpsF family glycosyltransferase [Robiginitomaculum antarcticum]
MDLKKPKTQNILNCSFNAVTEQNVLQWSEGILNSPDTHYIVTVNVAILMMIRSDERLKRFIESSTVTVADGQPIIWLSRLLGNPLPERIPGIDLCQKITKIAADSGKTVYLLGATNAVLNKTERQLLADNPALIIAGKSDGYFDDHETENRVNRIRNSGADILFVAMGVPRQEYFIQENLDKLGVNLTIALGGSFDVISGITKRAPNWMQNYGLEWFFRLLQEPRRLGKRYAITNTQFLVLSIKAFFKK